MTFPTWAGDPLRCEFLIRMLFSCLVDADWLDTEAHLQPETASVRGANAPIFELWQRFESEQRNLLACACGTPVNRARSEIYGACIRAAEGPQGVYRLTVPTGGGKTRSGMGFALRHALTHNLERIIVAIPYTSIVDQTAEVYKRIFGQENVLEHHCAMDIAVNASEDATEAERRRQLACENWDASIIVTTTVQLFESLFSNKPSRCRRIHNIARSVVILDEVQTLPINLLQPILDVLRELIEHYRVTVVLSTATQPALSEWSPYLRGLPQPIEIVPDPRRYFDTLRRVDYEIHADPWTWTQVADEMRQLNQVLCVVNSRRDALELSSLLEGCGPLHLSTLMCPAHRRDVLAEITRRLSNGLPCRVVSTQVVEAGVDLDFPVVFRAIGPLDRIVQAAGRCNREGTRGSGRVVVFDPSEGHSPRGVYHTATAEARILLASDCDLHCPEVFDQYYRRLWQDCCLDDQRIGDLRQSLDFPAVAERFRMIREETVPVVVYYGDPGPSCLLNAIRQRGFTTRDDWRRLQSFSVSIFRRQADQYIREGLIQELLEGLYLWHGGYDAVTGIAEGCPDPSDLVV